MKKNIKTALVLGGGGSRGAYQIGVWQALRELGIRIDMACGSSVGAINSAMIAQDEFDVAVELWKTLETHMVFDVPINSEQQATHKQLQLDIAGLSVDEAATYAKEILFKGGVDTSLLKQLLCKYLDEKVIRNSAITFGLTTVELPLFKLHQLFSADIPQGKLIDYIMASSAITPAVKPYDIDGVSYIDGSYGDILPFGMALDDGASEVICVNLHSFGMLKKSKLKDAVKEGKVKLIAPIHNLGNIMIFEKQNTSQIMRLGYLDAMKTFDIFKGTYCTFACGQFTSKALKDADAAGKIFELDPTIIYRADIFDEMLLSQIVEAKKEYRASKPPGLINTVSEIVSRLEKKMNRKSLTLHIAYSMKKDIGKASAFFDKKPPQIFADELAAARYILKFL